MSTISPFLSVDCSCDQALQATRAKLIQAGLSVVQTFNLNTARFGAHDCGCPNHGTEACDCQMIILLVYGNVAEPATLILHGNDGKTWVSIAEAAAPGTDARLIINIRQVLASLVTTNAEAE